jgi:tRNA(Arg) A34 adenosine deaminase TadA
MDFKNSAPCCECTTIIKLLKIKKIVYSCDDNKFNIIKPKNYTNNYQTSGRKVINDKLYNKKS